MDKYEYKIRADEIKELIARGEYVQAAEIADTIDWRRVKSVMMLCTISDLYKINRRYEDAKNMLLLAYERRPGGRTICYALCELCIKTEEFVQAVEYYKEFVQVAPKDSGRYILQYKLYEAQDVSLEERISVLEELKKRDYREKWAYELAYLYHRVGLATRCVEECDELILWFGDGKYVIKAMELKMLHQPLTTAQQEKYDHRFDVYTAPAQEAEIPAEEPVYDETQVFTDMGEAASEFQVQESGLAQGDTRIYEGIRRAEQPLTEEPAEPVQPEEMDIQVKTMDMGQYNTLNLQAELAAGLREVLGDERSKSEAITRSIVAPMMETESLDYPELADEDVSEDDVDEGVEQIESTEVFFGETGEVGAYWPEPMEEAPPAEAEESVSELSEMLQGEEEVVPELLEESQTEEGIVPEFSAEPQTEYDVVPELSEAARTENVVVPELSEVSGVEEEIVPELSETSETETAEAAVPEWQEEITEVTVPEEVQEEVPDASEKDETAEIVMNQLRMESIGRAVERAMIAQPPKELAGVLSQESDGQISLVVPEREAVEKQITGQMSITDILLEWEQMKRETEERRKEEVRQRVLQQTGPMFTEFEASTRDGLLEQLESGQVEGIPVEEQDDTYQDNADRDDASIDEVQDVEDELSQDEENLEDESDLMQTVETDDAQQPEEEGYLEGYAPEEDLGEVEELEDILEDADGQYDTEGPEGEDQESEPEAFEDYSGEQTESEAFEDYSDEQPEQENFEDGEFEVEPTENEALEEAQEFYEVDIEEDEQPAMPEEAVEEPIESYETAEEAEEEPTAFYKPVEEPVEEPGASYEPTVEVDSTEEADKTEEAAGESEPDVVASTDRSDKGKKEPGRKAAEEPAKTEEPEQDSVEREPARVRALTREEKELFAPYIQSKAAREQLARALDNISMASYTGNVIITGGEGMDTSTLAKNMIREVQMTDSNFSGKVAKISGQALNKKNVEATLQQLENGALIIQKASGMSGQTAFSLNRALQGESLGIIVVMEDTRKAMGKLLEANKALNDSFTARVDVEALSNDMLVSFGKQYAKEREYSIDDLGVLALHTRIEEMQTIDHAVTVMEVKEIVDEAIHHANRKTLGHFIDVLLARRYDEEDMIVLTEKDFA